MSAVVGGKLPSLEFIDLSTNELEHAGVAQLVYAHWPMLACVDVRNNRFNNHYGIVVAHVKQPLLEAFCCRWPSIALHFDDQDGEALPADTVDNQIKHSTTWWSVKKCI